jgi:hypothetical protein
VSPGAAFLTGACLALAASVMLFLALSDDDHSDRKATIGSMRVARRAGM